MSVSPRKLAANRANARKSTGPTTGPGKSRSARNATTLGIFSKAVLMDGESAREFARFRAAYLNRLAPRDALELDIVDRLVNATWRLRRLHQAETEHLDVEYWAATTPLDPEDPDEVEDCERRRAAGTYTPATAFCQAARNDTDLPSHRRSTPLLDRLARHERQLELTLTRCLKELRDLRQHLPLPDADETDDTDTPRPRCRRNAQNEPTADRAPSPFSGSPQGHPSPQNARNEPTDPPPAQKPSGGAGAERPCDAFADSDHPDTAPENAAPAQSDSNSTNPSQDEAPVAPPRSDVDLTSTPFPIASPDPIFIRTNPNPPQNVVSPGLLSAISDTRKICSLSSSNSADVCLEYFPNTPGPGRPW
jgi:hypothetical protein